MTIDLQGLRELAKSMDGGIDKGSGCHIRPAQSIEIAFQKVATPQTILTLLDRLAAAESAIQTMCDIDDDEAISDIHASIKIRKILQAYQQGKG